MKKLAIGVIAVAAMVCFSSVFIIDDCTGQVGRASNIVASGGCIGLAIRVNVDIGTKR